MKRLIRRAAIAFVVLIATNFAGPVGAVGEPWSYDPHQGPVGTVIAIHGSCADDVNAWEAVSFTFETLESDPIETTTYAITPGDVWVHTIVAPEVEPGQYVIAKQCHRVADDGTFDGGEATSRQRFVVEGDPEPVPADDGETEVFDATAERVPTPRVAPAAAAPVLPVTPAFTG